MGQKEWAGQDLARAVELFRGSRFGERPLAKVLNIDGPVALLEDSETD